MSRVVCRYRRLTPPPTVLRLSPPPRRCLRRATRACAPDFGATLERRRPIGRPVLGQVLVDPQEFGWFCGRLAACRHGARRPLITIDGALRGAALCKSAADSNATSCRSWPSHALRSRRRLALFSTGLQTHGGVTPPPACNRWLECHLSRREGWLCHSSLRPPPGDPLGSSQLAPVLATQLARQV